MRPKWENLRQETTATQVSFLDTEADTGITLASIALKASDPEKVSRNLASARRAYDTVKARLATLSPNTPGLESIHEKMATLEHMLHLLKEER